MADAGLLQNEVILAPETIYREWLYDPVTGLLGFEDFETPTAGRRFRIPPIQLRIPVAPDSDADGLTDDAEFIIGTNPALADTDGDGVRDGAEVRQGLDAASGRAVRTGVVGSVDTPGVATDVTAFDGLIFVADGPAGVAILNAFDGSRLVRLAQVDTPGDALRVAGSGNFVAVADGAAGLAVLDVSTASQARLVRQVNLGGTVRAVAAAAGVGFAGTTAGQLVSVDLASGTVLARATVGAEIYDLAVGGDFLFVLAGNSLHSFAFDGGTLTRLGTAAASPLIPEGITGSKRLFVANDVAYATCYPGYDTFNVSNPAVMVRLGSAVDGGPNSFKQIVLNGSGLGLATVGVNVRGDNPHDLWLYNASNPAQTARFVTTLPTPGLARAVSIYNGLAYVADSEAGLQVVNYLAYDTGTNAPTITLTANFPINPPAVEEGKLTRLTAQVTDDVQVRNVEFYQDGQRVLTDGNFPFEFRFITPLRASGRTNFTLRARAFDTGGNATWSELLTVSLVEDATPPRVTGTFPVAGAILGQVSTLQVFFNEPLEVDSLNPDAFALHAAGADGLLGSSDDTNVAGATFAYRDELNAIRIGYPTNLPPGSYEGRVLTGVRDRAGVALAAVYTWRFWIIGGKDRDQDGIPDDLETVLGYLPDNPDSNGDGIWDGEDDLDQDGLSNRWELLYSLNPRVADSNGDLVSDGDEDPDGDSLSNRREQIAGTLPTNADSDGDGWNDETELTGGSDPLNATSTPRLYIVTAPPAAVAIPATSTRDPALPLSRGTMISTPSAALAVPVSVDALPTGPLSFGSILAGPRAGLAVPANPPTELPATTSFGAVVATPSTALALPVVFPAFELGSSRSGAVVAAPPVQLQIHKP